MKCSECDKEGIKNGRNKNGVQRYRCQGCRRYWQISYLYIACERNINNRIVELKKKAAVSAVLEEY